MGTCGYKDLLFLFGIIITERVRRLAGIPVKFGSAERTLSGNSVNSCWTDQHPTEGTHVLHT